MAIYHLSLQVISRGAGRSAVAAAAYRSASRLVDAAGQIYDYRRKRGVLEQKIFVPKGCPDISRETLWQRAEAAEKRKNSCLAREMDVALPTECSVDENRKILTDFTIWLSNRWRVPVDVNVHFQTRKNLPVNNHAHLQFSTRIYEKDGNFSEKTRDWDDLKLRHDCLDEVRKMWAEICNKYLKKYETYIDHRSLKDQGVERLPQVHIGASATAMERRGIASERGNLNREILAVHGEITQIEKEINNVKRMETGSIGACEARNDNFEAGNRGLSAESGTRGGGQRLEQCSGLDGHDTSGIVAGQISTHEHEQGGDTTFHVHPAGFESAGSAGTRPCGFEDRCTFAPAVAAPATGQYVMSERMAAMKGKVREILYASDDMCREALAAVDARNTQVLQRRNFSLFKSYCKESLHLCGDITHEALAVVDRRNSQYMDHWFSASKKRHASRQKMAVFKKSVGNVLEVAYLLNKAAFTATDYNDAVFLHNVLNPPDVFGKASQDGDEDSTQYSMNM